LVALLTQSDWFSQARSRWQASQEQKQQQKVQRPSFAQIQMNATLQSQPSTTPAMSSSAPAIPTGSQAFNILVPKKDDKPLGIVLRGGPTGLFIQNILSNRYVLGKKMFAYMLTFCFLVW
jgi:hypothetical protein